MPSQFWSIPPPPPKLLFLYDCFTHLFPYKYKTSLETVVSIDSANDSFLEDNEVEKNNEDSEDDDALVQENLHDTIMKQSFVGMIDNNYQ